MMLNNLPPLSGVDLEGVFGEALSLRDLVVEGVADGRLSLTGEIEGIGRVPFGVPCYQAAATRLGQFGRSGKPGQVSGGLTPSGWIPEARSSPTEITILLSPPAEEDGEGEEVAVVRTLILDLPTEVTRVADSHLEHYRLLRRR